MREKYLNSAYAWPPDWQHFQTKKSVGTSCTDAVFSPFHCTPSISFVYLKSVIFNCIILYCLSTIAFCTIRFVHFMIPFWSRSLYFLQTGIWIFTLSFWILVLAAHQPLHQKDLSEILYCQPLPPIAFLLPHHKAAHKPLSEYKK